MKKRITLSIVEDSRTFRDALVEALSIEPDMKMTGAFPTAEDFFDALDEAPPDVIVMDIQLPGISGIESVWRVKERFPDANILMCTVFEDDENIFTALRAGACGYILKSTPLDRIVEAIREVAAGGAPMTPRIARRVVGLFKENRRNELDATSLTPRERDVLLLLAGGKQYKEIANELSISIGTIQSFVKSIYRKLHVHSRQEIMTAARTIFRTR